ncbi:histidine kinase [Nonomuraea sp. NPDC000554]|uniref:sensor histidine kinase n=1 Tax=Nonomuraea sp. NPDC000554 TaxID=3154259 RepID=UPI00332C5B0F
MGGLSSMRDRLTPWLLPAAAFCGAFFPSVLPDARVYSDELPGLASVPGYVQAAVVGLLAVAAVRISPERRWPLFVLAAADSLVRSPGLLLAVTTYLAATTCRRPLSLTVYAAVASLVAVVPQPGTEIASSLGGAPLFVWLPLALGLWAGARKQVVAGLRERAERLEREQAARTEQARAEERARIARDMHDVVAHRVSLMVLRAGALEINAADEQTAAEAELIRATGKEALTQLRAVLGVLDRSSGKPFHPQPTLADLDWLLDQSRSVGVPVERRDEGTAGELPIMVEHTAYRVVQEALTNIHKHAGPAATQVVLRHHPAALEVTVKNVAPPDGTPPLPGSGLGLIGLRERVELLGGEFSARAEADGGYTVSARLPA